MKKLFGFLFWYGMSLGCFAVQLSDKAYISLLTASPGEELYSTFGHSALRVVDPEKDLDVVFNYGTFDFDTPNFYVKFCRGKLLYKMGQQHFENFIYGLRYENRSVVEQVFNLNQQQKERLFDLLLENYKPENRYYKYDFFFDNCATRIRDLLPKAFGPNFKYHYPEKWKGSNQTFRNLIDLYLTQHQWSDFGIDLALGLPTDAVAAPDDYMFLPDFLSEGIGTATILHQGADVAFAGEPKILVLRKDVPKDDPVGITPSWLLWGLFVGGLILSIVGIKKGLNFHGFDIIYFTILGLTGWVVFFLWFFTDHIATKDNLNLLWAFPLHLPVFLLWWKLSGVFRKWYALLFGGIDVIILLTWVVFPQNFHVAFVPLMLLTVLRLGLKIRQENAVISMNVKK